MSSANEPVESNVDAPFTKWMKAGNDPDAFTRSELWNAGHEASRAESDEMIGKLEKALKSIPRPRPLEIEGHSDEFEAVDAARKTWNGYIHNIYFDFTVKNHVDKALEELVQYRSKGESNETSA